MPGRPLDHRRPTGLTTFGPLLLRALSSGCAALSGIEAISDSVTAFLPVGWRNARRVLVVMVELLFSKFTQGAWLVVLTSPILVAVFLRIRAHSTAVARRLRMAPDVRLNLPDPPVSGGTPTVVLVGQRHRGRFEAIRFARSSASELVEVPVDLGTEKAERFQEPGEPQVPDVPLVILASPFRSLVEPVLAFVSRFETEHRKSRDRFCVVVLPVFVTRYRWENGRTSCTTNPPISCAAPSAPREPGW